jgi:hypothetical protein
MHHSFLPVSCLCKIQINSAAATASLFFLISVLPAAALVGGAPRANQSIARHVVMVVG